MKKLVLLLWACNFLLSCGQKSQYEILSPCVSANIEGINFAHNPCVRRPANFHVV